MRITVDLPPDLVEALETACKRAQVSRSELVGSALRAYLSQTTPATVAEARERVFGLCKGHKPAGTEFEDALRDEWDKPSSR